ncbi:MAG: hypothetical protein J5I93_10745 [Pirellulaceae bacterium]|nr:hypothetical protein [Pirellulaceae bacterium]
MKPNFLLFAQARPVGPSLANGQTSLAGDSDSEPYGGTELATGECASEAGTDLDGCPDLDGGWWHFQLESVHGDLRLSAGDFEAAVSGERLELLAVVRGLEALDQPSRVTLVTPSRYVHRGLRFGLSPWRDNQWRWECFGELAPVKNADLWRRVDRALDFHRLECRLWRVDDAHSAPAGGNPHSAIPRPHFGGRRRRSAGECGPGERPAGERGERGERVTQWLSRAQRAMEQLIAAPPSGSPESWATCG